jgi:Lar family restriction alleviation protein
VKIGETSQLAKEKGDEHMDTINLPWSDNATTEVWSSTYRVDDATEQADVLLPCPFCGAVGDGDNLRTEKEYGTRIVCLVCLARGPEENNRVDAGNAWNKRISKVAPVG